MLKYDMSLNDIGNKYLLTILLICLNKHEDVNMTSYDYTHGPHTSLKKKRRGRVVACMVVTCVNRYDKSVIQELTGVG